MGAATMERNIKFSQKILLTGTWLAQSEECVTLDFGVVSLGPMVGVEITSKKVENRTTISSNNSPLRF